MVQRVLGQADTGDDVEVKRLLHLVHVDVLELLCEDLSSGIVDEHVQSSEHLHVLVDHLLVRRLVEQIDGNDVRFAAFLLNLGLDRLRVLLFFACDVGDRDDSSLAAEEKSD